MTLVQFSFKATRGRPQDYGDPSCVLEAIVLDDSVTVDNEDELVAKVGDIDSSEVGGYTRPELTGVTWDLTPEVPELTADDTLVEGLAVAGPSPLIRYVVVVVKDHDDTDLIGDLVAGIEATPFDCVGDLPVEWADGCLLTLEESDVVTYTGIDGGTEE
jgi:hypothetical protein